MGRRRLTTEILGLEGSGLVHAAVLAAARLVVILGASFLLYFLMPVEGFNEANPFAAWARLSFVVLVFLAVLALQVRVVLSASVPQVRAVEAVAETVVVYILLFAMLYLSLSTSDPSSFSEPLGRVDALYFTSSTFSTVGFGDIVATSTLTRGLVALQMMAGLGVLAAVAKVTFLAARRGQTRRGDHPAQGD